MKKIILAISCLCSLFLVVSCATTDTENNSKNSIQVEYDVVSDTTTIKHKDLQRGIWYNIYETANTKYSPCIDLSAYIVDGIRCIVASTSAEFIMRPEKMLFISEELNQRLELKGVDSDISSRATYNTIYYRERLLTSLTVDETNSLLNILRNNPKFAIIGDRSNSNLYEIPPKISKAMIELFTYDPTATTDPTAPEEVE